MDWDEKWNCELSSGTKLKVKQCQRNFSHKLESKKRLQTPIFQFHFELCLFKKLSIFQKANFAKICQWCKNFHQLAINPATGRFSLIRNRWNKPCPAQVRNATSGRLETKKSAMITSKTSINVIKSELHHVDSTHPRQWWFMHNPASHTERKTFQCQERRSSKAKSPNHLHDNEHSSLSQPGRSASHLKWKFSLFWWIFRIFLVSVDYTMAIGLHSRQWITFSPDDAER